MSSNDDVISNLFKSIGDNLRVLDIKERFICLGISAALFLSLTVIFLEQNLEFWSFVWATVLTIPFLSLISYLRAKNVSWITMVFVPIFAGLFLVPATQLIDSDPMGAAGACVVFIIIGFTVVYFIERKRHDALSMERTKDAKRQKERIRAEEKAFKREMKLLKKKQEMLADASAIKEYEQKLKMKYKDLEHQENVVKRILDHVKAEQA